jgi:hypothetical protein
MLTATLSLVVITLARAQSGAGEDNVIDDRMKTEIIDSVSHALNTTYVFPDVAAKIEKRIREQLKKKAYSDISSLRDFSVRLTEDIRSINNDRHLWVEYLTDENLALLNSDTTGAAAAKEELRQSKMRNFGFRELRILPGNVGYLKLNGFSDLSEAGTVAVAAMNYLSNADAIIIDLRDNGGGSPKMIQLLTSYFFDQPVHLNSFYIRRTDTIEQYWTPGFVSGPRLTGADLFVLTSQFTCDLDDRRTFNGIDLARARLASQEREDAGPRSDVHHDIPRSNGFPKGRLEMVQANSILQ